MSFTSTSTRSILRSTRTVLSQRSITTAARIAPRASLIKSLNARQPQQYRMASIISAAASTAHSAVASLVSASPLKAGDKVPDVEIRINDLEDKVNFSKLPGKNVLVLVPGAFSPTCSSQVPSYIESTADFAAKGVKGIYVVTVNDMFVVKAWKKDILKDLGNDAQSGGLKVDFTADDCGTFAHAAGLVLDAQAIFGGPRLKRGAIVIEDGIVKLVSVEPNPGEITLTHANEVLKTL